MNKVQALDARLRELVEKNTNKTRRNANLEELTDIPASAWASWWAGRARPSAEMLSALCTKWPETTLWLLTGADDSIGGQISPSTSSEKRQEAAIRYLKRQTELKATKNDGSGCDLQEWEVDELNALHNIRIQELNRRLKKSEADLLTQDASKDEVLSFDETKKPLSAK